MKEVTMTTTCEIITIAVVTDEDVAIIETHQSIENVIREYIKTCLAADGVNILKNQIFIRDIPNSSEEVVGTAVQGAWFHLEPESLLQSIFERLAVQGERKGQGEGQGEQFYLEPLKSSENALKLWFYLHFICGKVRNLHYGSRVQGDFNILYILIVKSKISSKIYVFTIKIINI